MKGCKGCDCDNPCELTYLETSLCLPPLCRVGGVVSVHVVGWLNTGGAGVTGGTMKVCPLVPNPILVVAEIFPR